MFSLLAAHPDVPRYVTVYPGPASAFLTLRTLPINGGTEITNFVLQWRENAAEEWKETTVPVAGAALIFQSVTDFHIHGKT